MRQRRFALYLASLLLLVIALTQVVVGAKPAAAKYPSLSDTAALLKSKQFVDLTHAFGPGIPHWYGFGDETLKTLYTVEKEGFAPLTRFPPARWCCPWWCSTCTSRSPRTPTTR
ncbi:MAG TPA: hypothetical protein VK464_16865 [Symbiobacteriaceae bacterium]|jgi:hypothetical protein|nr:hypothetical protein [Symbiobacteriaceae bacterium]